MVKFSSGLELAPNWQPIAMRDAAVKVVGVAEDGYAARVDWISVWIDALDQHFCVSPGARRLAIGSPCFDVLVLHGDDLGDLRRMIVDARATYATIVLIAVQSRASSDDRAALLNAGADTVWDLQQNPREAAASLQAVLRRHRVTHRLPVEEAVLRQHGA